MSSNTIDHEHAIIMRSNSADRHGSLPPACREWRSRGFTRSAPATRPLSCRICHHCKPVSWPGQAQRPHYLAASRRGRDGFWLHRFLTTHGIANHVIEPTSILINRRARRAKTDRLDAEGMLRVLAAYLQGDRQACSMVRVPTPDEEDAKRIHREREHLVQERLRIENRIQALLFTQGIYKRPSLRSWDRDLAAVRTGDGRELAHHLRAELDRLRRRLVMTLELIREVEAERDEAANANPKDQACGKIASLCLIRGVGANFAAVLTREVFYRSFDNRRQLASYVGITPMPYQSGGMDRDRRISRTGNPRA